MTNNREEVTQEQLDALVGDVSYLQDEAEALKYVIDEIPYDEIPPGGASIAQMLLLIDHAQLSWFRPVIEDTFNNPRPTHLKDFEHFESTFTLDEEKQKNIQKVLNKIVKHRAGLINLIKNIPLIEWESIIYKDNQKLSLYNFTIGMVRFERAKLKEIADLVLVFNQEKQLHRNLGKKSGEHPLSSGQEKE